MTLLDSYIFHYLLACSLLHLVLINLIFLFSIYRIAEARIWSCGAWRTFCVLEGSNGNFAGLIAALNLLPRTLGLIKLSDCETLSPTRPV